MKKEQKLELLQHQIDASAHQTELDVSAWRQQVEVAVRLAVGNAHPQYQALQAVRFTPRAVTLGADGVSAAYASARAKGIRDMLAILQAVKFEVEVTGGTPSMPPTTKNVGGDIFIIHGHDKARKLEVARLVAGLTGNEPVILQDQVSGGKTLIEKFEKFANNASFAIALATADDEGKAYKDSGPHRPRARQNVIFEWGYFCAAIGRDRVALLYDDGVELPSDVNGIVMIKLEGDWKITLMRELEDAGIPVDRRGLQ
ncbi:TIR domain-containing protein [Nocardia beijingensis]